MVRKTSSIGLALVAAALFAPPAHAGIGMIAMPMAVTSALAGIEGCKAGIGPASGLTTPGPARPMASKAAALLGRQVSQLELMRQQQSGMVSTTAPLEPAAGNLAAAPSQDCQPSLSFALRISSVAPGVRPAVLAAPAAQGDGYLASKRLTVRRTSFDRDWNRVRSSGLRRGSVAELLRAAKGIDMAGLDALNTWANRTIRYVEDRELYGRADHWATAGETLRLKAGDCEDIAIVKMQMLAAQGVRREDMHLVIARDLARASDHAMLVVKLDGQSWLLDNATDKLLDARQSHDYRPILSFSQNKKWIHGY